MQLCIRLVRQQNRADTTYIFLLTVDQLQTNHNGGDIAFGPDGYLYISVGDGGRRDGVHLLAQRLQAWNGKVLRIDVNSKSAGREYGIPAVVNVPGILDRVRDGERLLVAAFGSSRLTCVAAQPMQGAVLRPTGSARIRVASSSGRTRSTCA